jgi:hypothetical protein
MITAASENRPGLKISSPAIARMPTASQQSAIQIARSEGYGGCRCEESPVLLRGGAQSLRAIHRCSRTKGPAFTSHRSTENPAAWNIRVTWRR